MTMPVYNRNNRRYTFDSLPVVKYASIRLDKLEVVVDEVQSESGRGRPKKVRTLIDHQHGISIKPTKRFWSSFFSEFELGNLAPKFFDYFPYDEVFKRIQDQTVDSMVGMCLKYVPGTTNRFEGFGITTDLRHTPYDDVVAQIQKQDPNVMSIQFDKGVIRSVHSAKDQVAKFTVAGDRYDGLFEIVTPVDGYGKPELYIGVEREVCTNGLVARHNAFRSQFKMQSNGIKTLETLIDGFRNEDGYIQIKRRFENADLSFASMAEVSKVNNLLYDLNEKYSCEGIRRAVYEFSQLLGDFTRELNITSISQVPEKQAAGIPMRPTVLSLIQLLTEASTHHLKAEDAIRVDKFLGNLISNNYDLELYKNHCSEYDDFLLKNL